MTRMKREELEFSEKEEKDAYVKGEKTLDLDLGNTRMYQVTSIIAL